MTALVLSVLLSASAADAEKPAVAVAAFEVRSTDPELEHLGKGFADMIIGDLVAWDGMVVVDRERLQAAITELKLQRTKYFDPKTRLKLGKFIGARYIVGGSLIPSRDQLHVEAVLTDVTNGQTRAQASVTGKRDDVFDLEQELVNKLTASIDARIRDPGQRRLVKVPTLAALADYSNALDLSDQGNVEEASKAFAALVSKVPTFGLARERKTEILKQLEELAKRRKDMVTGAVLELAKDADATLAREKDFDRLDEDAQRHFLAMRILKGRVLLRTLKQHLSKRSSPRVVLKGHEAPALALLRTWLVNQQRLIEEVSRFNRQRGSVVKGRSHPPSGSFSPDDALKRRLDESGLGSISISGGHFEELVRFVLMGWGRDGAESFRVAPALGDLEPKTEQAVVGEIDARVAAAIALEQQHHGEGVHDATRLLELKADWLIRNDRIDDAIGAYQQILDAAPQGYRASWVEGRIKSILGGHDNDLRDRERWEKALKGCDDMDIRTGLRSTSRYIYRQGLAGLHTIAATLEKACLGKPRTEQAMEYMYKSLALDAGRYEDCESAVKYFRLSMEHGGSMSDFRGYSKNYIPWCDLSAVTKAPLPSQVRVMMPGAQVKRDERRISDAAAAVVADEFVARSIGLAPENRTRGDTRWLWVAVDLERKVPHLWFKLLKNSDEEGVETEVPLTNGHFDLAAGLKPILAVLRPGRKVKDLPAHTSLPFGLLEGLAEVGELAGDRKHEEAAKKLDALAKKYPGFPVIADLRAELEKKR